MGTARLVHGGLSPGFLSCWYRDSFGGVVACCAMSVHARAVVRVCATGMCVVVWWWGVGAVELL